MKKVMMSISLVATMLFAVMCVSSQQTLNGDGNIVKEERVVGVFTGIEVGSIFKVYIKQGKPQSVVVETDQNLLDVVETTVSGGKLKIMTKGSINNPSKMNAYITVENLVSLHTSGAASVNFETPFDAEEKMKFDMSGASSVKNASINADNIDIELSGAAKIVANIVCATLKVDASGAAKIDLKGSANKKLISASGATTISVNNVKSTESKISASGAAKVTTGSNEVTNFSTSGAAKIKTSN